MPMKREKLLAVHDHDLERFLRSIGLYEDSVAGRVSCRFCGEAITLESLAYVYPVHDSITVSCIKPPCLAHAAVLSTQEPSAGSGNGNR